PRPPRARPERSPSRPPDPSRSALHAADKPTGVALARRALTPIRGRALSASPGRLLPRGRLALLRRRRRDLRARPRAPDDRAGPRPARDVRAAERRPGARRRMRDRRGGGARPGAGRTIRARRG